MPRNSDYNRRITVVEKHIGTINSEMGEVKEHMASMKTDMCWIKKEFQSFKREHNKTQWLIFSAIIGTLIVVLIKTALGMI